MSMVPLVVAGVRSLRRAAIWWTVGIVTFVVVNLAFWPSLESSDALTAFGDMDQLLEAFGAQNIATPSGYVDGQVFALLLPLLLAALAITVASGLTAGDESAGRLELVFALPLDRRRVWLARWLAATIVLVVVTVASGLVTVACLPVFSLTEVAVGRVVGATVGAALLAAFHGSVAYLAAGLGSGRGASAGAGVAVLVAGYLMSFVLPLADSLSGARNWSPWFWALGDQPVTNGLVLWRLLLVAALTAALVAAGTIAVDRRDLRTA